jgi:hypothetical protein
MPTAMNGYSLEDHWATRKLTVVVGGYGSQADRRTTTSNIDAV